MTNEKGSKPSTLFPGIDDPSDGDDAGVILLTQKAPGGLDAPDGGVPSPEELLAQFEPRHTLDGTGASAKPPSESASIFSVDSGAQAEQESGEPLLLLAKRDVSPEYSARQNDPIPPLPTSPNQQSGDDILAPALLSPSIGEEDLLYEMSKELTFSDGNATFTANSNPLDDQDSLDDLPLVTGTPLVVEQTPHPSGNYMSPSLDDLPWVTGPKEPQSPPTSIPVALQLASEDDLPQSRRSENAMMRDLTTNIDRPINEVPFDPFSEQNLQTFRQHRPPDPMEQTYREQTSEGTDPNLEHALIAAEQQGALAKMPFFSLAPATTGLPTQGAASTHVDVDLTDDMFVKGLLDQLVQHCSRACLFVYQAPLLLGYDATLREPHMAPTQTPIKDVLFPTHLSSTFTQVIQSQQPYIGPLPDIAIDRVLLASLGEDLPSQLAIYPVIQDSEVVAVFTLDSQEHHPFLSEQSQVETLIKRAHELNYQWHPPDLLSYFEQL